jgi:hypothetical protein
VLLWAFNIILVEVSDGEALQAPDQKPLIYFMLCLSQNFGDSERKEIALYRGLPILLALAIILQ